MKRHWLRGLRSALDELLGQQTLMLHEPALGALLELTVADEIRLGGDDTQTATASLESKLGMLSGDQPTSMTVGNVAVLPIQGVISQKANWLTRALGWTSTEQLVADFRQALGNSQIKAIVFYVDSPGGTAFGNEESSQVIFQARGTKPIFTYVSGLCCSAAYYNGSAAQQIVAGPSALIGSIGAVSTHIEFSKALAERGIGVNVVRSAPRKQLWNQFEPLTGEAKATMQKFVSDYGSQFEAAVAKYRGVSLATVQAKYGQGDAFIASEAKQRGLIDGVMSWDEFLGKVQQGGGSVVMAAGVKDTGATVQGSGVANSFALLAADAGNPELSILKASGSTAAALAASGSHTEAQRHGEVQLGTVPRASAPPCDGLEKTKVNKKIKAALLARGLIDSMEASDELCQSILNAYFAARGEDRPKEDEKIVAALFGGATATVVAQVAAPLQATQNNVQQAHEREQAEAREAGRKDESKRQKEIRASAKLLNLDQAAIDEAIEGGKPHAEIVAAWHEKLANTEKPVAPRQDVNITEEGSARYVADATLATMLHFGKGEHIPKDKITAQVEQLSYAPLLKHAEFCLRAAGTRFNEYDKEDIAQKALAQDGYEREVIRADGGIAYNRPGSFPNLLSALANKILDEGVEMAETSYQEYTGMWPGDLPDFKPAPVVSRSRPGELDEVLDAEEFKEQGLSEECLSYMQLSRFGNAMALTPVLIANDDLGAFMEDLLGLGDGWELTQNRGCLRLITGNVPLLDGYNLYDNTNHGNHISSGGAAPSDSEWDAMNIKMANQTVVGGKARARTRLAVALVGTNNWRPAVQSFATLRDFVETKQPTTDSTLNVYRGKVTIVHEPDLNDSSTTEWYGFADPRRFANATIVRAYFRGFGRKGKRERWYDPKTKCYWVSLEGRFGAAVKNYRTTVKDKGAA